MKSKRDTRPKQIKKLAQARKTYDALKLARGWRVEKLDSAFDIVQQWQAVAELKGGAPEGFEQQLRQGAERATCYCVEQAIRSRDAEFFLRIAAALKRPKPVEDTLRAAVLSDALGARTDAKEIACAILGRDATEKQIQNVTTQVQRLRREYRKDSA
jgi:hypothetical protein